MTDRMESGTPDNNSAEPTKDPKSANSSQDYSCAEAHAHLEAFFNREYTTDLVGRLAQYVATCSYRSRLIDAETHLREILRSQCAEQAPPELCVQALGRLSVLRATAVNVTTTSITTRAQAPASGRVMRVVEPRIESSWIVHFERD